MSKTVCLEKELNIRNSSVIDSNTGDFICKLDEVVHKDPDFDSVEKQSYFNLLKQSVEKVYNEDLDMYEVTYDGEKYHVELEYVDYNIPITDNKLITSSIEDMLIRDVQPDDNLYTESLNEPDLKRIQLNNNSRLDKMRNKFSESVKQSNLITSGVDSFIFIFICINFLILLLLTILSINPIVLYFFYLLTSIYALFKYEDDCDTIREYISGSLFLSVVLTIPISIILFALLDLVWIYYNLNDIEAGTKEYVSEKQQCLKYIVD